MHNESMNFPFFRPRTVQTQPELRDFTLFASPALAMNGTFATSEKGDVQAQSLTLAALDETQAEKQILKVSLSPERGAAERELKVFYQLLRGREGTPAGELLAMVETRTRELGLRAEVIVPTRGLAGDDLSTIAFDRKFRPPEPPATRRDGLTNLRTGAALDSEDELRKLSESIPGKKLYAFLDYDHMGLADALGLGDNLEEVLKSMPGAAKASLGNHKFELFRRGGDEFVIVMEDRGEESLAAIKAFRSAMQDLKTQHIDMNSQPMMLAERFSELKVRANQIVKDYWDDSSQGGHTLAGFREHLLTALNDPKISRDRELGELTLMLAERSMWQDGSWVHGKRTQRVMNFSLAVVEIGEDLSTTLMHRALGTAEKLIYRSKAKGQINPDIRIQTLDELVVERSAEARTAERLRSEQDSFLKNRDLVATILGSDHKNASLAQLTQVLGEIERNSAQDHGTRSGILRFGMVADRQLRHFLDLHKTRDMWLTSVKLVGFSALNKVLGYERSDEILGRLAGIVSEHLPDATGIRVDGGRMSFCHRQELSGTERARMQRKLHDYLKLAIPGERIDAEFAVRRAFEARLAFEADTGYEPGMLRTVQLKSVPFKAGPENTFRDVLA